MTRNQRVILLLEDQPLLSWEIEETLRDAGIGEAVCVQSCSKAANWLSNNTPDVAVLDVQVEDGESTEIAEVLVSRGVPIIVHSGCNNGNNAIPDVFAKGTWVPKLSDPKDLLQAVTLSLRMVP
ncbi:response regulator [Neorhizobium sp. T786]|uniref:response regulator n=1 Tax=Pseudorhizobium xiangyangii TaxID=2883104 RepID=UPI001CFFD5BC|nr:response regulator [Neorhizobium xiangyangii]MCB5203822.1 response regulator [Neorhizobium xiangyangii]